MTAKPRKPVLVNLAWANALLLVLVFPVYLVSYAPAAHLLNIQATADPPGWQPNRWWVVYGPAEWVIDRMPFRAHYLHWADWCGTGVEVRMGILTRTGSDQGFYD